MTPPTHSPLPWRVYSNGEWRDADDDLVLGPSGFALPLDEEFALLACNHHAALVAALRSLTVLCLDYNADRHPDVKAAQALLAKVQP